MSVWLAIPSARPPEAVEPVLREWTERGYRVALWRNDLLVYASFWLGLTKPYPGYAQAVNALCAEILSIDPACDWIVTGGDDTLPDPHRSAEEIARECSEHFVRPVNTHDGGAILKPSTYGVMQPTGDRFAGGCIDRIAGSPWMGREWCLRANQGKGPLWPEFTHMFGDECLKRTAEKLGVYWARADLVHLHRHFQRAHDGLDAPAIPKPIPPHLVKWNTREHWDEMLSIFRRLEAEDFQSCLPL